MTTSHHEFGIQTYRPKQSPDRSFGLIVGAIVLAIAVREFWQSRPNWMYYAATAAVLMLAAWLRPSLLGPLNRLWMLLGLLLGKVAHPIVLGLLFYAVITPIALLARALGKDSLRLRRDQAAPTYWISRNSDAPTLERMRDQF